MLNPVFRWVCFALLRSAVMFDGWAQTLKQSVKSDITVRSEVQNSQVYKLKAGFSYFILFLFYIYALVHFLLSLHFTPSLQTQSAWAPCILHLVRILHPVCSLQSAVCVLHRPRWNYTVHFFVLRKKLVSSLKGVWQYLSIMKICYSWWQRSFCQS